MAESKIPKSMRRVLGRLSRGVITVAEASAALGSVLDKKLGTESKSLFRSSDPSKRPETYRTTGTGKKPSGGSGR